MNCRVLLSLLQMARSSLWPQAVWFLASDIFSPSRMPLKFILIYLIRIKMSGREGKISSRFFPGQQAGIYRLARL